VRTTGQDIFNRHSLIQLLKGMGSWIQPRRSITIAFGTISGITIGIRIIGWAPTSLLIFFDITQAFALIFTNPFGVIPGHISGRLLIQMIWIRILINAIAHMYGGRQTSGGRFKL